MSKTLLRLDLAIFLKYKPWKKFAETFRVQRSPLQVARQTILYVSFVQPFSGPIAEQLLLNSLVWFFSEIEI